MLEMKMHINHIPFELRELEQWVCWRLINRNGRTEKPPFQVDGSRAKANDPQSWTTFSNAVANINDFDGVGFVFQSSNNLVGIDLDGCVSSFSPFRIASWALEIV